VGTLVNNGGWILDYQPAIEVYAPDNEGVPVFKGWYFGKLRREGLNGQLKEGIPLTREFSMYERLMKM